jgi:hypothetical protein
MEGLRPRVKVCDNVVTELRVRTYLLLHESNHVYISALYCDIHRRRHRYAD